MPGQNRLQIAGSILGGDMLDLGGAIRTCERAGADLLQLDVCDGHFVPTISFGEEIVRRTSEATRLPVEVHLMVSRPEDWVLRMAGCGHFRMIFHIEASRRAMGLVQAIERAGWRAGVAMNPETPAGAVETLLPYVDNVCIMGIAPGFAGQTLLDYTYVKIADVRALVDKTGSSATITVDGGVKANNARQLVEAGADVLVVSSGIYAHANPDESLNEIRRIVGATKQDGEYGRERG
ncbi:MAG: ribulose-phosphate 3-epimerase [Phycisphaerae bacterium]|nr:ribulose-phosphate 3-epimerase [Phycisphaerae bacterium]